MMSGPSNLIERLIKNGLGRVAVAALSWTVLGFLFALPSLSSGHWQRAQLGSLAQWWSWGLVTPLILWADRSLPFSRRQLPQRMLAHLAPSFIFTSFYIYIFAAVLAVVRLGPWNALTNTKILAGALRGMFLWSWLVYWLILGASQIYHYYEHYLSSELQMERLERNFSEARLNALRMQLDPHFLFNALNTISSQVERDPRLARGMIEHLGDLLRLSLESKDRQEVPLAEEMSFLDHYVAIQKIRFGDQLKIETQISPEVKYASVPCLFVQPLVENAIRHGISRRSSGGTVVISAQRDDDRLDIRIIDDGVGLPIGWTLENSTGLGLSVTRERIAGLYPNGSSRFAVNRRDGGGTEVEISLPLRMEANGHAPA
ncbi:MAG TPA: sensor histidine kinase [Terriglobales bacterium]|jgi:signal transduction histidine kinase|nr:sensor histidine kinase [Terriglobales bacterium]